MQSLYRILFKLSSGSRSTSATRFLKETTLTDVKFTSNFKLSNAQVFSAKSRGGDGDEGGDQWGKNREIPVDLGWEVESSWSTRLTTEHFDGQAVGHQINPTTTSSQGGGVPQSILSDIDEIDRKLAELEAESRKGKTYVDGWGERMRNMSVLLKQVREPGARGSYLKDSEKAEMYKLHKENPEVYTVGQRLSDHEAERIAGAATACQGVWLRQLVSNVIGVESSPPQLKMDNMSAIALGKNPILHDRSKHIDTKFHYIRECVDSGAIGLEFVGTQDQLADILTKPLGRVKFQELRGRIDVTKLR